MIAITNYNDKYLLQITGNIHEENLKLDDYKKWKMTKFEIKDD